MSQFRDRTKPNRLPTMDHHPAEQSARDESGYGSRSPSLWSLPAGTGQTGQGDGHRVLLHHLVHSVSNVLSSAAAVRTLIQKVSL